jgi:RimJ/RimL family protein N-acetyltransferase
MALAVRFLPVKLNFYHDEGKKPLKVEIETDRFYMRSTEDADKGFYRRLFGDVNVMTRFSDGKPRRDLSVDARVDGWIQRWRNGDPFSGLAIFEKRKNEFIGHIVLGYGSKLGEAELVYLTMPSYWQEDCEEEIVKATVEDYAKALSSRKECYVNSGRLESIRTTIRSTNEASILLIQKLGMQQDSPKGEQGPFNYIIKVSEKQSC